MGTDPLRPFFGTKIYSYIDAPVNIAVPNIKKEIIDTLAFNVPEVTLDSIKSSSDATGQIVFEINLVINGTAIGVELKLNGGSVAFKGITGQIILNVELPQNVQEFTPSLTVDNKDASPAIPGAFTSVDDMTAWVKEHWAQYGTWGVGYDNLILYLDPNYKTGRLEMAYV